MSQPDCQASNERYPLNSGRRIYTPSAGCGPLEAAGAAALDNNVPFAACDGTAAPTYEAEALSGTWDRAIEVHCRTTLTAMAATTMLSIRLKLNSMLARVTRPIR